MDVQISCKVQCCKQKHKSPIRSLKTSESLFDSRYHRDYTSLRTPWPLETWKRPACDRGQFRLGSCFNELFISSPSLQSFNHSCHVATASRPRSRLSIAFILLISFLSRRFAFHLPSLRSIVSTGKIKRAAKKEWMRRYVHLLKFPIRIWFSGSSLYI